MPYKCVHCSKLYEDNSQEILTGCSECGKKFFFFMKMEQIEKSQAHEVINFDLTNVEKKQIEEDVREIAGLEDEEVPVFLDFESIKIVKPGKYLLDISNLFSRSKPLVYKLEDGKYIIDLKNLERKKATS